MTISFVGAAAADANSVSIPSHQQYDLLIAFAYRNASNTLAAVPSGWTLVGYFSNNTNSIVVGMRIAESASEVSGTWTNANQISVGVYRSNTALMFANSHTGNSSTVGSGGNIQYGQLVGVSPETDKWLIGAFGHRSNDTDIQVAPAGMTNRTSVAGASAGETGFHDTNANYTSWTLTNYTLTAGTSSGYVTTMVEIVETPILISSFGGGSGGRRSAIQALSIPGVAIF